VSPLTKTPSPLSSVGSRARGGRAPRLSPHRGGGAPRLRGRGGVGRAHKVHFVRSVFGRGRARASKGPREPPRQQRACALRLSLFTPPTVPTLAGRRRAGGPGPQHCPGERGDFRPQRSAEARPERARAGDRAGAVEGRQPLDHLRGCGAREHPAWARLRAPGSAHNAAARAQARWGGPASGGPWRGARCAARARARPRGGRCGAGPLREGSRARARPRRPAGSRRRA